MKNGLMAIMAAAVLASGIAAESAEAGSKKLNFGYPLGSFNAHSNSSHGAASNHKAKQRALARKKAAARKKALARKKAAARKRQIAAAQAKKKKQMQIKLAKQREIARQRKIAEAKKRERAQRLAQARADEAATKAKVDEPTQDVASNDEVTEKRAPIKASALAGVNRILPGSELLDEDGAEVVTAKADTEPVVEEAAPAPSRSPETELTCKKYVPSAGLTISVPCGS